MGISVPFQVRRAAWRALIGLLGRPAHGCPVARVRNCSPSSIEPPRIQPLPSLERLV